jgi:RIO-like serine/threonine protein kinase|tara:strand:- start:617 stop:1117 length:501 start_codon:yes stop_codon:yes gene_type:complete
MTPFHPKTETVNKDRKYFTEGNSFIKHDWVINRGVNEAEKLRLLDHKFIQSYCESYIDKTYHVLNTVHFDGETLENAVLHEEDLIVIKSQLLEVAAYLTAKGVIHQDINVSNVLWDGKQILVIDWESAVFGHNNTDILGLHPHSGILNTMSVIFAKLGETKKVAVA